MRILLSRLMNCNQIVSEGVKTWFLQKQNSSATLHGVDWNWNEIFVKLLNKFFLFQVRGEGLILIMGVKWARLDVTRHDETCVTLWHRDNLMSIVIFLSDRQWNRVPYLLLVITGEIKIITNLIKSLANLDSSMTLIVQSQPGNKIILILAGN